MGLAMGSITRLRTRALYQAINNRASWHSRVVLTDQAVGELQFWRRAAQAYNSQPIWFTPAATRVAYSDASSSGFGGYVVEVGTEVAHGLWTVHEAACSSTWREMKAVERVVQSFASRLAGHRVKLFTDNQNVARIIHNGSKRQHLQDGALSIFLLCLEHNIRLQVEWIPRSDNEKADALSRIIDYDDWQLNPAVFWQLDLLWGPHTIDRFADDSNAQIPRFDSRWWCPRTEAVDTFTRNWRGENNWWVPPLYLVGRTVKHAMLCGCVGTLLIPRWESAPFWPLLCPDGVHLAPFVHNWCEIPCYPGLVVPGRSGSTLEDALTSESSFLALRIDFLSPPRRYLAGFCTTLGRSCVSCSLLWRAGQCS